MLYRRWWWWWFYYRYSQYYKTFKTFNFFFKIIQFGDSQKLRLVRILRSTVMVRVGGGWISLDDFLKKYDPCRGNYHMSIPIGIIFIVNFFSIFKYSFCVHLWCFKHYLFFALLIYSFFFSVFFSWFFCCMHKIWLRYNHNRYQYRYRIHY